MRRMAACHGPLANGIDARLLALTAACRETHNLVMCQHIACWRRSVWTANASPCSRKYYNREGRKIREKAEIREGFGEGTEEEEVRLLERESIKRRKMKGREGDR